MVVLVILISNLLFFFVVLSWRLFFNFFFSSIRLHTRSTRDWSSDVCSSDLLAERGRRATLHHVCFVVDDLRGTLGALEARGVELIDREPRRGADGDVAFLHPRASGGVLVELIDRASLARRHTS